MKGEEKAKRVICKLLTLQGVLWYTISVTAWRQNKQQMGKNGVEERSVLTEAFDRRMKAKPLKIYDSTWVSVDLSGEDVSNIIEAVEQAWKEGYLAGRSDE